MRLRLDVSYDGTDFSGWAKQPDRRTVQGVLEDALHRQPPGEEIAASVVVAGRTDAGVHATAQVVHVDVVPFARERHNDRVPVDGMGIFDLGRMQRRWNRYLPPDVRIVHVAHAPPGFDARFSALQRHYQYYVTDSPWGVAPLQRRHTLWWDRALDIDAMNRASDELLGLHDFAAFCKARPGATTIRQLRRFHWTRVAEHLIVADVSADAFCHSMVRSLVGTVLHVGDGRRDVTWPARALHEHERVSSVAPPHGLTLTGIDYPPDAELEQRAQRTRHRRSPPSASSLEGP